MAKRRATTLVACGTPTRCPQHGRELHGYPCWECQEEWRESHPKTVAAIALMADPKTSYSKAIAAYRKASREEADVVSSPGGTDA